MKKLINTAFFYAIAGMAGGVFYREFTKLNGFTEKTSLIAIHPHLLALGMGMFLMIALLNTQFNIIDSKKFKWFYVLYNTGIGIAIAAFLGRGISEVLGTVLSKGLNASISGIAGLGHILIGTGIILLFLMLKEKLPADKCAQK